MGLQHLINYKEKARIAKLQSAKSDVTRQLALSGTPRLLFPIARYTFDEGSGTSSKDMSANGYDISDADLFFSTDSISGTSAVNTITTVSVQTPRFQNSGSNNV